MRKLLLLLLLILIFSLPSFFWWGNVSGPADIKDKTPRSFLITKGQSAGSIAKKLAGSGLIKSELAFRFYTQLTGREKAIQAGNYEISPNLSLKEMVSVLMAGPKEIWVTYPEGLRREEIAIRTIKTLNIEGEEAVLFWSEFMRESEGFEGFLFPETYLFSRDITAKKVFNKLRSTFDVKVTDKMRDDAKAGGMTVEQVVALAAVIERETKTEEERPVVSGILRKRLEARMPLQVDATLQYLTGNKRCGTNPKQPPLNCSWWQPPTAEDKKLQSLLNTYTNRGLPPSPIANPGLSSLKAAIYPEDSPFWYYLHGKDGKIRYAKTLEEHNENIRKYL
ncbi:MAG: endolytic transglycosylase MltG [Candidatus Blackburnbacteria bacterium]|nr:endolytic transglycosylase MltG [Candidatus Blackburnbacteria bacterium]